MAARFFHFLEECGCGEPGMIGIAAVTLPLWGPVYLLGRLIQHLAQR